MGKERIGQNYIIFGQNFRHMGPRKKTHFLKKFDPNANSAQAVKPDQNVVPDNS